MLHKSHKKNINGKQKWNSEKDKRLSQTLKDTTFNAKGFKMLF